MQIKVYEGAARLNLDIPVFIGTTGKGHPGSTHFPIEGVPLKNFLFYPEVGDTGTLVFDCADPKERAAMSATIFQYHWDNGKLVVTEKIDAPRLKHKPRVDAVWGLQYTFPDGIKYYTWKPSAPTPEVFKHVELVALIKFCEGKIDRAELDKHVIE